MPVHTDEAVNASILGDMLGGKPYRYDPVDRHGPTLYYATFPLVRVLGAHDLSQLEAWQLRGLPALLGAALVAAVLLFAPGVRCGALLATSLWLAVGAPFVYYGRYWIHETLFVLLSLLLLASCWRYLASGRRWWAVGAGLAAGTLFATKETAVITLAGAIGALLLTRIVSGPLPWASKTDFKWGIVLAVSSGALAAALLFSSFGGNPRGIVDALGSMNHAAVRAGGQGHEKPFYTYLAWMLEPGLRSLPWCGWLLAAFGLAGAWTSWQRRGSEPLPVFFLLYTGLVCAVYSAIPYKTPWLGLNFLAPAAVIAGIGFSRVCEALPERFHRGLTSVLVVLIASSLAAETRRLCFTYPSDPGNPLAYSPTVPDILRLEARVEALAAHGGANAPVVAVVGPDIWPLPWYLRHCPNVGYWPSMPASLEPSVVICSADQSEKVSRLLGSGWRPEIFGLRPEVLAVLFTRLAPGSEARTKDR